MFREFNMTSLDITEAFAYHSEEPYGAVRDDIRAGMSMTLFHAAHKGKNVENRYWYDFLPNSAMPEAARDEMERRMAAEARAKRRQEVVKSNKEALANRAIAMFKAFNTRFSKTAVEKTKKAKD